MALSLEQAQSVIDKHSDGQRLSSVNILSGNVLGSETYILNVANDDSAFFILALYGDHPPAPLSPSAISSLLSKISSETSLPVLPKHVVDTSQSTIPANFILSFPGPYQRPHKLISLADALHRGSLSELQLTRIELRLGTYIAQLHAIQNDFFGRPPDPSAAAPSAAPISWTDIPEPILPDSYSWQETFTFLLDNLLHTLQSRSPPIDLPYKDIQAYLSRAIAFFLFDDADVPCLTSFTLTPSDIFLTDPKINTGKEPEITLVVPRCCPSVLYGDPLLEYLFSSSPAQLLGPGIETEKRGPSDALIEGYGKELIVFPRQKTKRLWYDFYLALRVFEHPSTDIKLKERAMIEMNRCMESLKNAPCY